jgi:hypothetical protein
VTAPFPQREEKVVMATCLGQMYSYYSNIVILCRIVFIFLPQVTAPFPQREEKVVMATCLGQGGAQEWAHTKDGRIIHKVREEKLRDATPNFSYQCCGSETTFFFGSGSHFPLSFEH